MYKYQVCAVVKRWAEPGDQDAGINVQTAFAYAADKEEARVIGKRMLREAGEVGVIEKLSFFVKINLIDSVEMEALSDD